MPPSLTIIGAGAAGLMAAIAAGRAAHAPGTPRITITALDSARTLGAKVLVAGGGRCNVTHHEVTDAAYAGSSRNAIRKVLRAFTVEHTISFFADLGVTLKREDTGKLFPTTDRARTILDALLTAARDADVRLIHPWRVQSIQRLDHGFLITSDTGETRTADRIILATGGRSLPKSGSDGHGHTIARSLGHSITPRVFPALVPLTLPKDHFLTTLSGITLPATLEVRAPTGKKLAAFTNSTLFTHFGLSGPGPLDISRYYTQAKLDDPDATLIISVLPDHTPESLDAQLLALGKQSVGRFLRERLPERLAEAIALHAAVDPATPGASLSRDARKALVKSLTQLPLPITGDRGYTYAEVTAGGVPLAELHLDTMESRVCPGLHLCGEICDVDGRIGGFNFQWAWASGHVAGTAAAHALVPQVPYPLQAPNPPV